MLKLLTRDLLSVNAKTLVKAGRCNFFIYEISGEMFYHFYRDLYGDAMLVLSGAGVNRSKPTDGHALSFASKA